MGTAIHCRNRTIHAPGLGMRLRNAGMNAIAKKGKARPKPSPANIRIAKPVGNNKAAPIAAAMKGPVQGVATTAASTPVQNEPAIPPLRVSFSPAPMPPISKRPARLAVTDSIKNASNRTTAGSCNWNAQPTSSPAARKPSMTPPRTRQLKIMPSVYATASRRASPSSPPILARLSAFSPNIGNTQGIRFSSKPPSTENIKIKPKPSTGCCASWVAPLPNTDTLSPPVGMAPGAART